MLRSDGFMLHGSPRRAAAAVAAALLLLLWPLRAQEPGTEAEIKDFCSTRFHVTFPMTAKNAVIGNKAHPFYKWIVAQAGETAAPRWNFHKYLIDSKGELAGAFPSKVAPEDEALTREIERELKA